jgi:maltooligosyltrehalose trehalohydrolase
MHRFGVWGPRAHKMALVWRGKSLPMDGPNRRGWWTLEVPEAQCSDDYAFLIDDDPTPYPDPRSLQQPAGVHGASRLYDHAAFEWHDASWRGLPNSSAILYEIHIGTFSAAGTFDGAIEHLPYLHDLGITHVELLPVAEFAGERGWGYDGVALFSAHGPYGGPDGLKRFVDACHAHGIAVILDVVYNHFGPVGNYCPKFGPYLTDRHKTPWGSAVNLDEGGSDEVRRFFCDNATMWLRDYHVDGLRFDAVHEFYDRSATNFLEQLSGEVERLGATCRRDFYLIAESDLNDPKVVRPREARGYGMNSQWSDDFHHSLFTLLYDTEPGVGYYDDFGTMGDLHKALKHAFVFDGQYSGYRLKKHGRPVEALSAHHFIHFDQNHDQVGNRAFGERLEQLCGMDAAKVALGIVLTAPYIPMLFMGEEFASSSPFLYFADHEDEDMRRLVAEGRKNDFAAFGFGDNVPNPEAMTTFNDSKLKWEELHEGKHEEMLAWTRALIQLRKGSTCFNDGNMHKLRVSTDDIKRTLLMQRETARIAVNLGHQEYVLELLDDGEEVCLKSSDRVRVESGQVILPPLSMAVMLSSAEAVDDREASTGMSLSQMMRGGK